MSIYDDVLDMANKEQEIAGHQVMNAFRVQEMATKQRAWQQEDNARQALIGLSALNAQDAQRNSTPGSVAEVAGQGDPMASNPALVQIQQDYKAAQRDYQYNQSAYAAIINAKGSLAVAKTYQDEAAKARTNMEQAQTRLLAQRKETLSEVGGAAATAYENNFPQVKAQLDRLLPGWSKGQDYDVSPLDGSMVWGNRTARLLDTLGRSSMSAKDQIEAQLRSDNAVRQVAHDEDLANEYASRDAAREQTTLYRRERLEQMDTQNQLRERALTDKETGVGKTVKAEKPATVPRPTAQEVNDNTPSIKDATGLPPADARVAARDFVTKRNALMAADKNLSQDDAETQALDWVRSRVQAPIPGKEVPWYIPGESTPATPAKYVRGGAPQTAEDTAALVITKPLLAAGLDFKYQNGVISAADGTPVKVKTPEQAKLLPSGTRFVDPSGTVRIVP